AHHRVCIVGSGPSAFYCAKYILESRTVSGAHVDMLEKLPVPYGMMCLYGVAPDHPEVKNVTDTFGQIAQHPRFRYFGNVEVGRDVSLQSLKERYSAVVLGYGADGNKIILDAPEYRALRGVYSAREFVNWYNGHPDYVSYGEAFRLNNIKRVAIVGHGNVALDCARILTKSVEELRKTDIADHALAQLQSSTVESVSLIGRRGPVQSSFTIKEFRELTRLGAGVRVVTEESAFEEGLRDEASRAAYEARRPVKRIVDLVKTTAGPVASDGEKGQKSIYVRYLLSPVGYISKGNPLSEARLRMIEKKALGHTGSPLDSIASLEVIPCDLVLMAVGYQSSPIAGADGSVPFDDTRNVVPNTAGRVQLDDSQGRGKGMLYAVGWVGRGPTGIIGTNIPDAKRTAETLLNDLSAICVDDVSDKDADPKEYLLAQAHLNQKKIITWDEFLRIDTEETRRGEESEPKRPRVKITNVAEMIRIAKDS
ncbi:unnamed protein product, partial [Ectocarpus fasciculatus]